MDLLSIKSLHVDQNLQNLIFYKDMFLISNLFEVFRLLKHLDSTIFRRKYIHRAFKNQKKKVTSYKGKRNELYKDQPIK